MSQTVIKVESLGKSYLLRHQQGAAYSTFRESLTEVFRRKEGGSSLETFWALKDVSFDVKQGDRIGIIGRNGAGKSTLLKMLSRIVVPTKGRITIDGRVASLLEVGTGFHPELSGRENIFLNGAILGMSRNEIRSKFDEIVAFAEVDKFLDTPVKRYSSGMYVRLAFAVAAHLEPEILIVDEVLAVGDAEFQKKCLGKMKDVSGQGRTVLFVSHNMAAIQNLCDTAIFLQQGQIQMSGEAPKVVAAYLRSASESAAINIADRTDRSGNQVLKFQSVALQDESGKALTSFQCGKKVVMSIRFKNNSGSPLRNLNIAVGIDDEYGQRVGFMSNDLTDQVFNAEPAQERVEISIPKFPFRQGIYTFSLYAKVNGEVADWVREAGTIDVEAGDFYGTGKLPPDGQGQFLFDHSFSIK